MGIISEKLDTVKYLYKNCSPDINHLNINKRTPPYSACYGENIDIVNIEAHSPLQFATLFKKDDIANFLMEKTSKN